MPGGPPRRPPANAAKLRRQTPDGTPPATLPEKERPGRRPSSATRAQKKLAGGSGCKNRVRARPDYFLRKIEARRGFSVVFGLISVFVVLTHGVGLTAGDLPEAGWWFCFALIYGEAAIATLCYFLMMLGDAGVVRRTPETCLPVPPEVAERLRTSPGAASATGAACGPSAR